MSLQAAPEDNELEVSLFGPGYGECVVLHLGGGKYAIVDSCVNINTHRPVALEYLENLGVEPSSAVVLIVATHWHDDHIRGLADILGACSSAKFVCSDALNAEQFYNLVALKRRLQGSCHSSGLQEFYDVFSILRNRGQKFDLASGSKRILKDPVSVWTLSPSSADSIRFRETLASYYEESSFKTRVCSPPENHAAVALCVESEFGHLLLGSDVLANVDNWSGWNAIVASDTRPDERAQYFKIPHHGGKSGHDNIVWDEMLVSTPIATLTPWVLAGDFLPTYQDANRLLDYCRDTYITSSGKTKKSAVNRDRAAKRTISEVTRNFRSVPTDCGQVRVRWRSNGEPEVHLFNGALPLSRLY